MQTSAHYISNSLRRLSGREASTSVKSPIIQIDNATFYRHHPSPSIENASNPEIFPNLTFSIKSSTKGPENWAILGASSSGKTTFLEVLRGLHLCFPPDARTFPYLSSDKVGEKDDRLRNLSHAIRYVGFGSERSPFGQGAKGSYLSARYESRREETDFSLLDYLKGNTSLNALKTENHSDDSKAARILDKVVEDLKLEALIGLPIGNLSNGQRRRAMIAKALLGRPEILLLDEPFMGLDPPTLTTLTHLLKTFTLTSSPRLVLALRPQDPLPEWITHIIYLGPSLRVAFQGLKDVVLQDVKNLALTKTAGSPNTAVFFSDTSCQKLGSLLINQEVGEGASQTSRGKEKLKADKEHTDSILTYAMQASPGEPLVEMEGVRVAYGQKQILGDWEQNIDGHLRSGLWWTIRRGERWGMFGPNGSGKTTILSLVCSDHPQAYSLPIKVFGRTRLPRPGQPGISIFDLQARIGHSSPEVHAFFPRNITLRHALESAWADTFLGRPVLNHGRNAAVDACLHWFRPELDPNYSRCSSQLMDYWRMSSRSYSVTRELRYFTVDENIWAEEVCFGDIPFSSQRIVLFLRAIIKTPELVILDEAFSGMDSVVRSKCMLFLEHGEQRVVTGENKKRMGSKNRALAASNQSMHGLSQDQALICVSHVAEEVPDVVRDWVCLPEAHGGQPARFGHLEHPLGLKKTMAEQWDTIWAM